MISRCIVVYLNEELWVKLSSGNRSRVFYIKLMNILVLVQYYSYASCYL